MVGLQVVAHPVFLDDVRRGPRADGAVRVAHGIAQLHLLAVLEEPRAVLDDFRVQRVGHMVARLRPVVGDPVRAIHGDEQRVEVQIVQMRGATADLGQQIGPSDDLVDAARADAGQQFPHLLRVEGDEVHHLVPRCR
jgi:hypothetical protein